MNSIHPSAQLIGEVSIGAGNTIGPLAVIIGPVTIGDDNWIGTGALIGAPPEVRDWPHPVDAMHPSSGGGIELGSGNIVREYVQIHQGWSDVTRVGDQNFVMNQCYVAHDCQVENHTTLASSVLLAGHVRIGSGANLGLGAQVHQRIYIGVGVMLGMGSVVTRNIPPFAKAFGNPARIRGANRIGMERSGMRAASIDAALRAYTGSPNRDAVAALASLDDMQAAIEAWNRFGVPRS
ncbi:UDP-N-acetylglucosamine acyltransferase [Rathayibacter soli]|uniref:UDP-N-acetylglucosamine acyltransferase n=1 Tax=Rathayibacter soli TaxID=3144168 RepID=UPI0027E526AD|nr:UDP-N-acetylglucosamine acyltransferase [Glaciibacter superstes]